MLIKQLKVNDYQTAARSTAIYPNLGNNISYPTLGLTGEVGEICNKIKKIFRDDKGVISTEKRFQLSSELGDVLWYISNIASELGLSLENIAQDNIDKLESRKQRGKLQGDCDNR